MTRSLALLDQSVDQLRDLLASWGEPAYRARQLWARLYQGLAASFDEMTELPKLLRERLAQETVIGVLAPRMEQRSSDGQTRKILFALPDGAQIESVLMGYERRRTVCISTQAGCAMGCLFCATGQGGLQRNLASGEIIEQVLYFARELKSEIGGKSKVSWQSDIQPPTSDLQPSASNLTNIVLMGMGEPFANYDQVMIAVRRLNDPTGFNFGARRMTVSTVGLAPGIEKLAQEDLQINLAVSLHAATDDLRDQLVPINKRYPLSVLLPTVREYIERTHRRVSLEWALIEGVNDTLEQAHALARFIKGMLCHVNLIPLNPTGGYAGAASTRQRIAAFRSVLESANIPNTLRRRRGIDIQAGCGQLRQKAVNSGQRVLPLTTD
jgi:23S rRNA (adenine2503-C2)-methyltransferase